MAVDRVCQADLNLRLDQSICRYKEHPYFVYTSGITDMVYPTIALYKLGSNMQRASFKIDHRDDDFDDSSPPLGYMNYGGKAYYLKRLPHRQQHQGLRAHCIARVGLTPTYFTSSAMEACILGNYADYETAMSSARYHEQSTAIHRHIAIVPMGGPLFGLHYKGRLVATRRNGPWEFLSGPDGPLLKKIIDKTGVVK